ncbi:DUF6716 putative glycosyltransferase [Cyanobium sp. CH-040]|uniref:DUF6716 putative glycosyltransferase n=1 Tax=Cyanobium sp. CH-040 TaxID=2823708 RepID=UPI0020CF4426|nr:DUF6716 putative glycosyltransferase [Cyanobium sp. CH-040]MCP9928022.1 hypothetical protein [Cyanobium sp. CH-040]
MRLALISDTPGALEACRLLGRQLQAAGAEVTLIAAPTLAHEHGAASPPDAPTLALEPLAAAASELLDHVDAAGVFVEPQTLQPFLEVRRQAERLRGRPACPLFTGPPLPLVGDALSADLLPRLGYDLICLQGPVQVEELGWLIRGTPHAAQAHEPIGLWGLPIEPIGTTVSREPLLVVLEQEAVPAGAKDKALLYRRLRSLALAAPDWTVRLQPDYPLSADPEEWDETALAWHHGLDTERPANLQIGRRDDLTLNLMLAWACVGISSPWLLSAMVWGKPAAVVADYGIRTDFDGPLFFGCGLMRQLADCLPLEELLSSPRANPGWLAGLGWTIADGPQRLLRRLGGLRR